MDALRDANLLLANGGLDSAASRAYYAAFHAVTALFGLEGRTFAKHSALEAAVHRDLVKTGKWASDLGRVAYMKPRFLSESSMSTVVSSPNFR